ncbi:MAG: sulfide/dihydroorotate dehydrogenase-like FAD/NAD-binding protein [Synergistaceae bacterium]|nr:sulfide/dihydroorotate dehydrogenase-like FAD/NAD-binding protein [Synergistaceae bacterium]
MFTIVSKKNIAPQEFDIWVEAPRIAKHTKAGQFVVIRIDECGERIPLTIADNDEKKGLIRLIFQVIGNTTAKMSTLEVGDSILDISGPLGTPSEIKNYGTVLMVGGGVGIAALYPIIKALKLAGNKVITILGGRTSDLVIMKEDCAEYSDELIITTDDGSEGMKGVVTGAMEMVVEKGEEIDHCWCIGPSIMMKYGAITAKKLNLPIFVSLNSLMIDGTGMCGCCRVTVDNKIRFACVDGPEFDGLKVDWDEFMSRLTQYKKEEKASMKKYETEVGEQPWH